MTWVVLLYLVSWALMMFGQRRMGKRLAIEEEITHALTVRLGICKERLTLAEKLAAKATEIAHNKFRELREVREKLREAAVKLHGDSVRLSNAEKLIKDYGEDRVKRGDELAELGGQLAWYRAFWNRIENAPLLHSPLSGTFRLLASDVYGDWEAFTQALNKATGKRRRESAKTRRVPLIPNRRVKGKAS